MYDFKKRDSKFGDIRFIVEIGIGSIFFIGAIAVTIVLGNWGNVYHVYFGLITAYITGILDIGIGLLRKFPR